MYLALVYEAYIIEGQLYCISTARVVEILKAFYFEYISVSILPAMYGLKCEDS